MLYPFMTLNDGTEIVHSETLDELLESVAHIILQLAREGGIEGGLDDASGF